MFDATIFFIYLGSKNSRDDYRTYILIYSDIVIKIGWILPLDDDDDHHQNYGGLSVVKTHKKSK